MWHQPKLIIINQENLLYFIVNVCRGNNKTHSPFRECVWNRMLQKNICFHLGGWLYPSGPMQLFHSPTSFPVPNPKVSQTSPQILQACPGDLIPFCGMARITGRDSFQNHSLQFKVPVYSKYMHLESYLDIVQGLYCYHPKILYKNPNCLKGIDRMWPCIEFSPDIYSSRWKHIFFCNILFHTHFLKGECFLLFPLQT